MINPFKSYRESYVIKDHLKTKNIKNIIVGDYSYYSGYYYEKDFEECIMYLDEQDNESKDTDKLIIGKFCSIATGVKIMMGGTQGHNYDWISTYDFSWLDDDFDGYQTVPPKGHKLKGDTIIGNDVWIGAEAMIMPGVKIGDGAIIAARSHVVKDIEPYSVVGGNPAKLIKMRFSDQEIEMLLKIQWWDWSIEKIKENLPTLRSRDIKKLSKVK